MLVAFERMPRADVAPGQKHGAVALVAGRVEDVAEIDRFAQALLDPPDESGVCLVPPVTDSPPGAPRSGTRERSVRTGTPECLRGLSHRSRISRWSAAR